MHLYGDTLEHYIARDLPPKTLIAIDAHLSNCLFCAHALAEHSSTSAQWERQGWLGRLVRVERPVLIEPHREEVRARAA
jgi:hypothetical protein